MILRLEEGKATPSIDVIGRLAKALDNEPQELLTTPPGRRQIRPYPYPRFRLVDRALIQRCGLVPSSGPKVNVAHLPHARREMC
jgi:hypothetical protein